MNLTKQLNYSQISQSLTTYEIIYCLIFPNNDIDTYINISIAKREIELYSTY
jgi:hypothetical protein